MLDADHLKKAYDAVDRIDDAEDSLAAMAGAFRGTGNGGTAARLDEIVGAFAEASRAIADAIREISKADLDAVVRDLAKSAKGTSATGGLWRNNPETPEGKYLVKRRDGTVPSWPYFVIAASDPAAPAALRAYADTAYFFGYDPQYIADVRARATEFEAWRAEHGKGDPDAPRHRVDDPATVAEMKKGYGS